MNKGIERIGIDFIRMNGTKNNMIKGLLNNRLVNYKDVAIMKEIQGLEDGFNILLHWPIC